MKYLVIMLIMAASRTMALEQEVSAFKSAVQSKDSRAINVSLVNLGLAIEASEPYDGSPYNNPSAARLAARAQIQQALEPIKSALIQVASSSYEPNANSAIDILGSTSGGSDVYNSLKTTLTQTNESALASSSLYSLDKLSLADPSVEQIAVKRIAKYDPNDTSGRSVAGALFQEAMYVPLPSGLDTFIKFLDSSYPYRTRIAAAQAVMAIGPTGAKALPKMEQLLLYLQASNADFRYINDVKRAIGVVKGEATSIYVSPKVSDTSTAVPTSNNGSFSPSPNLAQPTPKPSESPSVDTSFPLGLFVIIGASIILFAVLGYFLWYKRP